MLSLNLIKECAVRLPNVLTTTIANTFFFFFFYRVDKKCQLQEEGERWRARGLCDPAGAGRRKRGERGGEDSGRQPRGGFSQ